MSSRSPINAPPDFDTIGLWEAALGDGRLAVFVTGMALFGSGGFAVFQSVSGHFLPHDVAALGMDAKQLAVLGGGNLVRFMFHDRVSFGGVIGGIGLLYGWLAAFPLRRQEPWAWWTLVASGTVGFASFLSYLGYGYFDSWHGVATALLLPVFLVGVGRSRPPAARFVWRELLAVWVSGAKATARSETIGRWLLQGCGIGMIGAGLTILALGMTIVFVPQDLTFIGRTRDVICGLNPNLVPVIAHDRAGFGGGLVSIGVLIFSIARWGRLSRHLVEIFAAVGILGFGSVLGVHYAVGYMDVVHLGPAWLATAAYLSGWVALARAWLQRQRGGTDIGC